MSDSLVSTTPQRVELPSIGLSIFECPICYEHMMPPYLQCQNGHMVCDACLPKIKECTVCRERKPHIRVRTLENLVEFIQRPCKNADIGCKQRFLTDLKRNEHENECDYKLLDCPCPKKKCKWMGRLPDVMSHFTADHKSIVVMKCTDSIVLNAINARDIGEGFWMMVQQCHDKEFLLTLSKRIIRSGESRFYFIAQLIGTRMDAQKFKYSVKLQKDAHKLEWTSSLATTYEPFDLLKSKLLCFELNENQMRLFAQEKDLVFTVQIEKLNDDNATTSANVQPQRSP